MKFRTVKISPIRTENLSRGLSQYEITRRSYRSSPRSPIFARRLLCDAINICLVIKPIRYLSRMYTLIISQRRLLPNSLASKLPLDTMNLQAKTIAIIVKLW